MSFVSYAQNFEDVLLWRALKNVQSGFYIDVGAADPREGSVTQAFYERGWNGINVEPEPTYAERLKAERPRDVNLAIAAGSERGTTVFHRIAGTGLSTLNRETAELHSKSDFPSYEEMEVEVRTIFEIWTSNGSPEVHFLKIDVEGAERNVLQGCCLDMLRPWIVVIEATKPLSPEPVREEFEELLISSRYERCWFDGINDWYIPTERSNSLRELFQTPPNPFDDYVPVSLIDEIGRRERAQAKVDALFEAHEEAQARIEKMAGFIRELEATLTKSNQRLTEIYDIHQADQRRIAELERLYLSVVR